MEKGSALGASSGGGSGSGINGFAIGAIVIAVLLAALILLSVLKRNHSSASSHYLMDESSHNRSFAPLVDDGRVHKESSAVNMKPLELSSSLSSRTPSGVPRKSISDNEFENKLNHSRRSTDPISLVTYSSSDLQAATGNFHSSRLLGQGTIGGVYKAKYTDGRVRSSHAFIHLWQRNLFASTTCTLFCI